MTSNVSKGKFAEDLAVRFLTDKGFAILARNYRCRFGEIDIIFEDKSDNSEGATSWLVFCEVKAKFGPDFGLPEDEFNNQKYERFNMTILDYLAKHEINHENYRIDLIAMDMDVATQTAKVRHHKNFY